MNPFAREFNPSAREWKPGANATVPTKPAQTPAQPQPQTPPQSPPPQQPQPQTQVQTQPQPQRPQEMQAPQPCCPAPPAEGKLSDSGWEDKAEKLSLKDELDEDEEDEKDVSLEKGKEEEAGTETQPTQDATAQQQELVEEIVEDPADDDPREHISIFFMGHVDAGKSTISGNLLYITGMVDKRTIEKYERESKENNRGSWYLAYIMDTNEEERARGKTVEVGKAYFETEKKRYTILDCPGHKAYVPNMIQGAVQADIGCLVISAKTGEFESGYEKNGQTREHLVLAKTLGIKRIIVLINKMDEVKWSQERYDDILNKISTFMKKELGYNTKTDVTFIPISGYLGDNLKNPVNAADCPWWQGQPFINVLDELPAMERKRDAPLRIPVSDKFRDMGFVFVLGKIESGIVRKGQVVTLMPNKTNAKVVGIYIRQKEEEDKELTKATAGHYVRLAFQGVDESNISAGMVVCSKNDMVHVTNEFIAQIQVKELASTLFTAGYQAMIHIHTALAECTVTDLVNEIDPATRKPKKKKPVFVKVGALVTVKIQTATPICCEVFADYPQLGRFTFRDKGKTVAIGRVESIVNKLN